LLIFILIQALITLFVAGGLFFKEQLLKNRTIGLYFALFSLEVFYFFYGTSQLPTLYPQFIGRFYFSIGLIYGPLLWFHFNAVINPKTKLSIKDILHFIPLFLLNIHMLDLIIMPDIERMEYFNNREHFFNRILYLNYVRALHQVTYGVLLYKLYKNCKDKVSLNEKFYLGGVSIIYFVTTIIITLFVLFANSWRDFSWYYMISVILILLIVYVLYNDPKFFKAFKEKYSNSSLKESEMLLIKNRLEKLFNSEHIFLNNALSIEDLSKELDVKTHHISQTFTNVFNENFNDYVNRFRVEYSKKLFVDPNYNNFKIEAIAKDSGFNNKVTFYKSFSKFVNLTPSAYRKMHKKV